MLYVAGGSDRMVRILDVASQQIVTDVPLNFQPTGLDPFGSGSFVLASRSQSANPLWLFAATPQPGAYFVPAIQLRRPVHQSTPSCREDALVRSVLRVFFASLVLAASRRSRCLGSSHRLQIVGDSGERESGYHRRTVKPSTLVAPNVGAQIPGHHRGNLHWNYLGDHSAAASYR